MTHVSLQPEYIASFFGFQITNTFLTSLLVTVFLVILVAIFHLRKRHQKGFFMSGMRIVIFELLKLTDMVTKNRKMSKKIFPLIATFFLFIISANLLALLPGFLGSFYIRSSAGDYPLLRSPNSDLNTTVALALFSVISIQIFSLRILGIKNYLRRFFNFSNPIKFILGFFEMTSEAVKVLSFSFRLFGNIFAGEILLLIIAFLVPYVIPVPFMVLEVFVGVIQAFIFSILTLTFVKTSTIRHIN